MTSRVPVGGKASVCLICMKYRIIILIIIIKRLVEILLSYIAHTCITHAHTFTFIIKVKVCADSERREWPSAHAVSITALHGR